jgi:hypothetical protein
MIRLFTILILVTAGLPRFGVGSASGLDQSGDFVCHQAAATMACCSTDSAANGFCPMSNGPCECVAPPAPDPRPKPEAPLPRSDRDTVTGMPNGAPRVTPVDEPRSAGPGVSSLVLGLNAGRSHNEIQALLGVWRT